VVKRLDRSTGWYREIDYMPELLRRLAEIERKLDLLLPAKAKIIPIPEDRQR
jgi:hypothetical protein